MKKLPFLLFFLVFVHLGRAETLLITFNDKKDVFAITTSDRAKFIVYAEMHAFEEHDRYYHVKGQKITRWGLKTVKEVLAKYYPNKRFDLEKVEGLTPLILLHYFTAIGYELKNDLKGDMRVLLFEKT